MWQELVKQNAFFAFRIAKDVLYDTFLMIESNDPEILKGEGVGGYGYFEKTGALLSAVRIMEKIVCNELIIFNCK